jgi:hypothetical protein
MQTAELLPLTHGQLICIAAYTDDVTGSLVRLFMQELIPVRFVVNIINEAQIGLPAMFCLYIKPHRIDVTTQHYNAEI